MNTKQHGGPNRNQGRKPSDRGKTITITVSIFPDQFSWLSRKPNKSEIVREALDLLTSRNA